MCQDPWTVLGNRCYLFLEGKMNWHMAKAACKQRSGYLAEVDSDEENNLLIAEKRRRNLRHLWIGLNEMDKEGVWRWSRYQRQAIFLLLVTTNQILIRIKDQIIVLHWITNMNGTI